MTRYLEKRYTKAGITWVYNPPKDAIKAGILQYVKLGSDPVHVKNEADKFNKLLDNWRRGIPVEKTVSPKIEKGTLGWLFSEFFSSTEFSERSQNTKILYRKMSKYI